MARSSGRLSLLVAATVVLGAMPGAAVGRQNAAAPTVPHFTDATAQWGAHITGLGNSSAWIDYDGDEDLDLFVTNSDFPGRVWLYRNDGTTFSDVTQTAGFASATLRSVAWGDYDRDGRPDLAATTYAAGGRTRLYHNEGDGTFLEVGAAAGMMGVSIPWRVAWADYDRDGYLDLYQADLGRDLLYHNDGDGTFTEVAMQAGVTGSQSSQDAKWADYDGDGWPDLYVADDGPDHLYRNLGDGTFEDEGAPAGVTDMSDSQAACWGDYDGDGRLDLYVANIGGSAAPIRNRLYRNNGDGTFTERAAEAGVQDVGDGRTCNWLDVDNDGRLDLYATNHIHASRMFRNNGDGTFVDIAGPSGLTGPFDVFNGAWGDLDADGDLDLFAVGHIGNALLRNDGPVGGSVELALVGVTSNPSAIGAEATLRVGNRRLVRQVEGASGAYGQDSLALEFGVGPAPGPFMVRIRWPSGATQTLTGVAVGSRLTVTEPSD
jgi:hypothetical protein